MKPVADGLYLAGCAACVYGTWLIHEPSAYILGGLMAIASAVLIARGAKPTTRDPS